MKKLLIELFAMAVIVVSYGVSLHAQSPAKPAPPTTTIAVPTAQRDAIVTAQRDYALAVAQEQQAQQQEQVRQQRSSKDIQALADKIAAAVTEARTTLKLDKDVPFDPIAVSFTVPDKKK